MSCHGVDFRAIETQIARTGITLGIDWSDAASVQRVVREALQQGGVTPHASGPGTQAARARLELWGLAALMLKAMRNSDDADVQGSVGAVWEALARALSAELLCRDRSAP